MPFNIIDAAKSIIPTDLLSKISSKTGEDSNSIQKALTGAIPSVLAALLGKSPAANETGLLNMVKEASGSSIMNNISAIAGGGDGGMMNTIMGWLRSLFGDKLDSVISAIAGFAGIKSSSATSVLQMAAPAALGSLGKYSQSNNLNAAGLSSFIQSQRSVILGAIPSGLDLAGALGLPALDEISAKMPGNLSASTNYTSEVMNRKSNGWLWLLILLVVVLLIWLLSSKGCSKNEKASANVPVIPSDTSIVSSPVISAPSYKAAGKLDTVSGDFVYDQGEMITISLPNNSGELKAGKWSTEARLVQFLTDPEEKIDSVKGNWFDLTDVRFRTGGTVITPSSMMQLQNLVMIVKAFPEARFKIGGYTDNTGDAAKNLALSQKRAEAVAAEIIRLGAAKKQLAGAEGYGDQHPVGNNDTEEGRAMNRRVSVNVKSK